MSQTKKKTDDILDDIDGWVDVNLSEEEKQAFMNDKKTIKLMVSNAKKLKFGSHEINRELDGWYHQGNGWLIADKVRVADEVERKKKDEKFKKQKEKELKQKEKRATMKKKKTK